MYQITFVTMFHTGAVFELYWFFGAEASDVISQYHAFTSLLGIDQKPYLPPFWAMGVILRENQDFHNAFT